MDQAEKTNALILQHLVNMPVIVRDELVRDRNITRMEDVLGEIEAIKTAITSLKNARPGKERKKHELLLEFSLGRLIKERGALQKRTSFVLPVMISAMVTEISAMQALGKSQNEIRTKLALYEHQFDVYQDVTKEGSLAFLRGNLEQAQKAQATKIAQTITKKDVLVAGNYDWYKHGLVRIDREIITMPSVPNTGSGLSGGQLPPSQYTRDKHVDVHWRAWTRTITLTAYADPDAANLYRIMIGASFAQYDGDGGASLNDKHYSTDDAREADPGMNLLKLQKDATLYNERNDAVLSLIALETMASSARILITNWNDDDAAKLVDNSEKIGPDAFISLDRLSDNERQHEVLLRLLEQSAVRDEAWRTIAQARRELKDAIDIARAEKWRSDVARAVNYAQLAYNAYTKTAAAFTTVTAEIDSEEQLGAGSEANNKKPESKTTQSRHISRPQPSRVEPRPRIGSQPIEPNDLVRNEVRARRIIHIVHELKNLPKPPAGQKLVGPLTHGEVLIMEATGHLKMMAPTNADKFFRENKVTLTGFIKNMRDAAINGGGKAAKDAVRNPGSTISLKEITDAFMNGSLKGMRSEALKTSLGPTPIADGTFEGELARLGYEREINSRFSDYLRARTGSTGTVATFDSNRVRVPEQLKPECSDRPCYQPMPPKP